MTDHDRLVEESETLVVGAAMLDADCAREALAIPSSSFGFTPARRVHEAIAVLDAEGRPCDAVSVRRQLAAAGDLGAVGEFLVVALEFAREPEVVRHHVRTVEQAAALRAARSRARQLAVRLEASRPEEFEEVLAAALAEFSGLVAAREETCEPIGTLAARVLAELDSGATANEAIPSGLEPLDRITDGFHRGELILLGARPSVGKSSLATTIAGNVASAGRHVLVFSLEVPRKQAAANVLAARALVSTLYLRRGDVDEEERRRLEGQVAQLAGARMRIDDDPSVTVARIRSRAARLAAESPLDLVIVDYLQLVSPPKAENRNLAVASMSRDLKLLARELNVPVLCLSQLNREADRREGQLPKLADLRDSGALEQDADVVVFLHREGYGQDDAPEELHAAAVVKVAKNRNGPTGVARLRFHRECLRFLADDRPTISEADAVLGRDGGPR
ncbi:MAG: DnaB-like helicase C-terminal domain-containing protein [Planctomycetota bacterium JB042]